MVYRQKVFHFLKCPIRLVYFLFSGGIERTWTGVPRRYYDSLTKVERCVCVQNADEQDGRFKQYKDCLPTSFECQIFD
jgi:hypothetical protein